MMNSDSVTIPAYPQLSNGRPDTCKPNMLLPKEVGVYPALCIPNDQEGAAHVTQLHLLMEVVGVHLKPSKSLGTGNVQAPILNRAPQNNSFLERSAEMIDLLF